MNTFTDLREILKTLKHRKPTTKYCPKCGTPNLHLSSTFDYWLTPRKYVCKACGYTGPVFMELEPETKENENG
jgi:ssDNA-binding Zn-finger/Zn-ribbon topoisomerase 1